MNKTIVSITFIQACMISILCGQSFNFHSNSPFGIEVIKEDSTRFAQTITFYDYDGDGDLDVLLTGLDYIEDFNNWGEVHFFIEAQENIGSSKSPLFGERFELFEDFPYPYGYFFASPGDLNNDGKGDLIVAAEIDEVGNATLQMYTNTGKQAPDQFDIFSLDAMDLPDFVSESFFLPELVDLDQDGDLDLMNSGFDPPFAVEDGPNLARINYARNIGTKSVPDFQGWYDAPYNLVPDTIGELLTSGDIDNDGDIDFIGSMLGLPSDSITFLLVHLNTPGADQKPSFTTPLKSPFGLPSLFGAEQFAFPKLADIDGDGDLDLFVFLGDANGQVFQYYENSLCTGVINNLSVTLCEGESIIVAGTSYSDAGDYTINLEGSNGCDSTIQLSITVDPIQSTILNESICEGEVILVGEEVFDASGDYMVFLVAANGCDSVVFLSLVVNENYIANLNESICNGDVYSIGLEDFTQTGHYEVLLFSRAGCDSLIALDLVVIEVDNSVNVNENILMAVQSGGLYQWVNCDSGENIPGATNQSYEVLETGNYAVNITDDFGCSTVSECVHVIISGTAEVALSKGITIYPNPTSGLTYILNDTPFPVSALTVTNLSGQAMGEFHLNNINSVDISFLVEGVYFVKMKINGLEVIKKLIII